MTFIFHPVDEWFQLFMCLREVNASAQACAVPWGTVHSIKGWALSWRPFPNLVVLWSAEKHLEKHQRKHWKQPHLEITSDELLLLAAKGNCSDAAVVAKLERQILPQICSYWLWEPVTAVCGLSDDQQAQQNFYVFDQTTAPRTMMFPPAQQKLFSILYFPRASSPFKSSECLYVFAYD